MTSTTKSAFICLVIGLAGSGYLISIEQYLPAGITGLFTIVALIVFILTLRD